LLDESSEKKLQKLAGSRLSTRWRRQKAVGKRQKAVGKRQKAVGSRQLNEAKFQLVKGQ